MYLVPDLRPTTYTVTSSRPIHRHTSGVRSSTRTTRLAAPWNRMVWARGAAPVDVTVSGSGFCCIWSSVPRRSPRRPAFRLIHGRRLPEWKGLTVDEAHWTAEAFEEHRAHLHAVAYRMLGSLAEAD